MRLTAEEFSSRYRKNRLAISIIGMSNVGKTRWSKRLSGIGFRHIACDDLIEKAIESGLKNRHHQGARGVAEWLGQPYEKNFSARQKVYLEKEKAITKKALNEIGKNLKQNTVLDTTGSVIYTGQEIRRLLQKNTLVIYIAISGKTKKEMFKRFLNNPKPLIWGKYFYRRNRETNLSALRHSYPLLLGKRGVLYRRYADVRIPFEKLKMISRSGEFLSLIKNNLSFEKPAFPA